MANLLRAQSGTVTLLFTDVVGSTELLQLLGDDAHEQLRRTHVRLLRQAVQARGGREVKNLGDGLMVVFASAVDAVACAVAMQQAVHRHNQSEPADRQLQVRVGLDAGEPIRHEDDYFGTSVVVAKRLCDSAEGGQIWASELVRRLVEPRGAHAFRDGRGLTLKGIAEPVAACEVLWEPAEGEREREAAPAVDDLPGVPPPLAAAARDVFVGRAREFAELQRLWDPALAEGCRLVLLAGEPGIGKTRLAAEFALAAYVDGATVLFGRSHEEALIPYEPFVEALRQYVVGRPSHQPLAQLESSAPELIRLIPELAPLQSVSPPSMAGDADGERYRLFEAVASLLHGAATRRPLLVILDDLHWADRTTLLLLRYIVRSPTQARLVILGTYRNAELTRSHPLSELLADLRRDRLFERVSLLGLGEEEVGSLIGAWMGEDLPPPVVRAVHQRTEGNPFFVEEVLRSLAESGVIEQGGSLPIEHAIDEIGIPESVKDVIGRRLARLSEDCNRVLTVASVVGREFDLSVLELVSDLPADRVLQTLEEAVAATVIEEVTGSIGRFSFSHALVRETLYDELSATRRVRLHRRIGEVIEELCAGQPAAHLAELAYHFFRAATAGEVDKALGYARLAGERADALLAYEEAAGHYETALQALELKGEPDEVQHCELLLSLGEARWKGGEGLQAREVFEQAAGISRSLAAPQLLARAALGAAGDWVIGGVVDERLVSLLEEAASVLGEEDSALRARVLARLALELRFSEADERRETLSQEAVEVARRVGDATTLATCLRARQAALWGPENIKDRLAAATDLLRLAEEIGDKELALAGHQWRLRDLLELGEIPAADKEIEAVAQLAEELRRPQYLWYAAEFRAMRAMLDGRFEEAERFAQQGLAIGQHIQELNALQWYGAQISTVRRDQGRVEELEGALEGFVQRFPGVRWLSAVAVVYAELGREKEAREALEQLAAGDFGGLPRDWNWLIALALTSEVCATLGDKERAEVLYRLLLPYAGRNVVASLSLACYGAVSYYLGLLAATLSRCEEADRHFQEAVEMNAKMGARPWVVRTKVQYAIMLLARGEPGDHERAQALLDQALAGAQELGMARLESQAQELLSQAGQS